jgi:hypothetical protein
MGRANAVLWGFLSTMFTYALTTLGAAGVFVFDTHGNRRKTDLAMSVAVGLMLAAVMELISDVATATEDLNLPRRLQWVPLCTGLAIACISLWLFDQAFTWCHREPKEPMSGLELAPLHSAVSAASASPVLLATPENLGYSPDLGDVGLGASWNQSPEAQGQELSLLRTQVCLCAARPAPCRSCRRVCGTATRPLLQRGKSVRARVCERVCVCVWFLCCVAVHSLARVARAAWW